MRSFIRGSILLLPLVVLVSSEGRGQQPSDSSGTERIVEILNADSARAARVDGKPADMLSGHVALRQGKTLLNAHTAIRFKENDQIIFEGEVTVVDEGDSLFAQRVVYESDEKTAVGTGDVRWSDGEVEITASRARYFVDDKQAEFEDDVVMKDSTTTVLSLFGSYNVREREASFRDDVYLEQRRVALTAEALFHERESGLTTAVGRVWVYRMPDAHSDDETRVILVADSASSERDSGINRLTGRAGMVRVGLGAEAGDTLVVRSTSVIAHFTDSTETVDATDGVRFWQGSLAGLSDLLHYVSISDTVNRSSRIRMLEEPILWSQDAQVTGDTIDVRIERQEIETLEAYEDAFVGFSDSTEGHIHQMRGRRLKAFFDSDSLRRLSVTPNAEALYFAVDSTNSSEVRALQFTSREITLFFRHGDIERITAASDVEGRMTELQPGDADPSLQGFDWRVEERPERDDLLDENMKAAMVRFESS